MSLTCLPRCVSQCLWGMGLWFSHRHRLAVRQRLTLHLVYGDRASLKKLRCHGPAHLADPPSRRLVCIAYRCTKTLLW